MSIFEKNGQMKGELKENIRKARNIYWFGVLLMALQKEQASAATESTASEKKASSSPPKKEYYTSCHDLYGHT